MQILGGKWRLAIVYFLMNGSKRFSDLERHMPEISQRMLSLNLRKLEAVGIISRNVLPEFPVKIEYQLTAEGKALRAIIAELYRWEESFPDTNVIDNETEEAIFES